MRGEIYWVDGPWRGRLAIVPRPRGGDWLEDEVRAWPEAGLGAIVSLLTSQEVAEFDLSDEAKQCQDTGLELLPYSITDLGVPEVQAPALTFLKKLLGLLAAGKSVGVHCRQSIGRSGLIAASLLAGCGIDPQTAFERVSAARGHLIPETRQQGEWVRGLPPSFGVAPPDA